MKPIYTVLSVFMVARFIVAADQPPSYSEYQQRIQAIYRQVVDLTAPSDLFGVTNFVSLYSNPRLYQQHAIRFLGDGTNSEECKMVVVYSLQQLPIDDYIEYERELLDLARDGKLSKPMLNRFLFPSLDWSTKIELNFEKPNVRAFLEDCLHSELITAENKAYFKDVLSGKVKSDILDLQDAGMLPKAQK